MLTKMLRSTGPLMQMNTQRRDTAITYLLSVAMLTCIVAAAVVCAPA